MVTSKQSPDSPGRAEAEMADATDKHPAPEDGTEKVEGNARKRKASPSVSAPEETTPVKRAKLGENGSGDADASTATDVPPTSGDGATLDGDKQRSEPDAGAADIPKHDGAERDIDHATSPRSRTDGEVKGDRRMSVSTVGEGRRRSRTHEEKDDRPAAAAPFRSSRSPQTTRARERRGSETTAGPERRRDFSQEERKRGQRLFGGLLSTLSQKSANPNQKRRQEIEKRQHDRAQQQRAEADKRRNEKLAKLNRARSIEQIKFDEQAMRTRHSTMLAMAHSLKTRSSPPLYYRPWDLTKRQEEKIEDQIRDAEAMVSKETADFERLKEWRLRELGVVIKQPTDNRPMSRRESTAGEPQKAEETPSNHAQAAAVSTNRPRSTSGPDKDLEDNREVLVETAEDMVIY